MVIFDGCVGDGVFVGVFYYGVVVIFEGGDVDGCSGVFYGWGDGIGVFGWLDLDVVVLIVIGWIGGVLLVFDVFVDGQYVIVILGCIFCFGCLVVIVVFVVVGVGYDVDVVVIIDGVVYGQVQGVLMKVVLWQ